MNVSRTSWHFRAYQAWFRRQGRAPGVGDHDPNRQLNLCHYTRVVFFFGPMRWFFQGYSDKGGLWPWLRPVMVVLYTIALGLLTVATYRDPVGFWLFVLGGVLVFAAMIGLGIGIAWAVDHKIHKKVGHTAQMVGNTLPMQYAKAKHHKVCPLIFVDGERPPPPPPAPTFPPGRLTPEQRQAVLDYYAQIDNNEL